MSWTLHRSAIPVQTTQPVYAAMAGVPMYTYGMPVAMPISYHPVTGMPIYPVAFSPNTVYPPRSVFSSHVYPKSAVRNQRLASSAYGSSVARPTTASKGPALSLPPGILNWSKLEDVKINAVKPIGHDLSKAIKIDAALLHSGVPVGRNLVHQTAMVSISETLFDELDKSDTPADIVCAIDVSGSMKGEKLQKVKDTLNYLLSITENCRIAIVLFNDSAVRAMNFKINNAANKAKISAVIQSISASGMTSITEGVKKAQELLSLRKSRNPVSTILLLTDGKHNKGAINNQILFGFEKSASQHYSVHSFGYGNDHDALLMREIAEFKSGNYYFIQDMHTIAECFGDCMGMVTTTLATNISLSVTLGPCKAFKSVTIDKLYEPQWKLVNQTNAVISMMGIYAGMKRDFLIDFTYSMQSTVNVSEPTPFTAVTLYLTYTPVGTLHSSFIEKAVRSTMYPAGQESMVTVNESVRSNLIRAKGADILLNANSLRNAGRGNDALIQLQGLRKSVASNPKLASDHVMQSMAKQIDDITMMLQNDLQGKVNAHRTENVLNQQINVFRNQATAPQFNQCMYQNRAQKRFVNQARGQF